MKKKIVFFVLISWRLTVYGQNEIGPEGHKLLWVIPIILVLALLFYFLLFKNRQKTKKPKPIFRIKSANITVTKDRLYYPDVLKLVVKNNGNVDVDLDKPMLIFDNFWIKRKFRIKGTESHSFYPLFLEKGKSHSLHIHLNRFYTHDKSLKKFPKAQVIVYDVKGKKLGSKSVFLRKTLVKF